MEEVVTDLSDVEGSNGEFGIASCVTYGILCEPGTALAIQVNDDNTYKFLVLNDDGEKVTLIMAEDLGEPIAWINESHYESLRKTSDDKFTMYGPITALEALKTRTSDWTNLTEYSYTLDYGFEPYSGEYVQNVRARMLQRSDISSFSEFNDELNHDFLPIWLLGDFNEEYWLSDSCGSDDEEADCAYRLEQVPIEEVAAAYLYSEDRLFSSFAGLRPVITINK